MKRVVSEKTQKLIDELNASPLKAGDQVIVLKEHLDPHARNKGFKTYPVIDRIEGDDVFFKDIDSSVKKENIIGKYDLGLGVDPFDRETGRLSSPSFSLESILFAVDGFKERKKDEDYKIDGVELKEANWDPFIYDKEGKKQRYQRPFVWSLEDKQNLIESIYNNVDCGKVLVRKRSWSELEDLKKEKGETELAFVDVVDGKQRLNAVIEFVEGKFQDMHGNFFGDLTVRAQIDVLDNHLFSYSELAERTPDQLVLKQFLKLNFAGVPQSKEHLDFVRELLNRS